MTGITIKGGLERIVFEKINNLINQYDISIVYFGKNSDKPSYEVDARVRFYPIKEVDAYSSFTLKFISIFRVIHQYKSILKKIQPDIVINANANLLSWIIPFMYRRTPKIVELHQSYDGVKIFNRDTYGKNSLRSKFLMLLRNMIYPLYDKVVVLTRTDQQKWGYKNCIVIPNFTNLKPYPIQSINRNNFTFIWTGRICHQKGIDLLLDVWTEFCKINNKCNLIIIGNGTGKYKQFLDKYLSESPYTCRLTYIPQTDNISEYYAQASAFISTSRFEGLPLVLIEATTMGLPIIGFNITGNNEVIINGQNGYLVEPYDRDAFIKKMMFISSNPIECQSMSIHSKEIAKRFSKKEVMDKWTNLFVNLIQKK